MAKLGHEVFDSNIDHFIDTANVEKITMDKFLEEENDCPQIIYSTEKIKDDLVEKLGEVKVLINEESTEVLRRMD
jgi:hypothetical protein